MARKPRRIYDKTLGKMVSVDQTQQARLQPITTEIGKPLYADGDPDRLVIRQRALPQPEPLKPAAGGPLSQYEELLHSIYDAVLVTDRDGNILEVNARARRHFGLSDVQLRGMNVLSLISGADARLVQTIHNNVSQEKFTILEAVCTRGDGTRFYGEIVVNRLTLGANQGLCFFVRDVSQKKLYEKDLKETNVRLIEAERAKARFDALSAVVSEINNPLQILVSMAELENNTGYKEQLDRIVAVIERIQREEALELAPGKYSGADRLKKIIGLRVESDRSKALLIADEPKLREIFAEALRNAAPQAAVETAADIASAVESFKKAHHGIVVVDLSRERGAEEAAYGEFAAACDALNWDVPSFVFCTGFLVSDKLMDIVGDGSRHCSLKRPVSISDLARAVKRCLAVGPAPSGQ